MNKKLMLNLSSKKLTISDPVTSEKPISDMAIIDKNSDMVPTSYPGGKGGAGVYQTLINMIPPHDVYIETHLGSGAIMRHKRPAKQNIGVDIDPDIISKWNAPGHHRQNDDASGNIFINDDAFFYLQNNLMLRWPKKKYFIYCDPPYLMETRKGGKLYEYEYTTEQHIELLNLLEELPPGIMIMISGYWSELYADMLSDWNTKSFQAQTRQGPATEWIWYNYPDPTHLHDYSYLGTDFRERERIKRKVQRWSKRLESLPVLERNAIMEKLTKGK